jgi:predicted ester cyclase
MEPGLISVMFEKGFNQGNLTVVEDLLATDSITHLPAWGLPQNRLGLKQLIASLRDAFPDLHCIVEDEIHQGDKSAALCVMRGTHQRSFFGHSPTGRRIEVQGIIFTRSENDLIVENWILVDQMGILQQLGIVPPTRTISNGKDQPSSSRIKRELE